MHALLGKITHVDPIENGSAGLPRWRVRFKAACVLPHRTPVPEWLKDQTLTLERAAADPREVGGSGDSIVLSPAESALWLAPLVVTPTIAYGAPPEMLRIELGWWQEEKLPEFTVRAGGRQLVGQFAKEEDRGVAYVEPRALFAAGPRLPVTIEVTCDRMKAACVVLPENEPCAVRLLLPEGETYRVESPWYAVDVSGRSHCGGIASLREQGRSVNHFRLPKDRIQEEFDNGGVRDRLRMNSFWGWFWDWSDSMKEAALTCVGVQAAGETTRLALEGIVDEGQNLRTTLGVTLFHRLPLLYLEREYRFGKGKEKEGDGKGKSEKPKEPIDEMRSVCMGFRAAAPVERDDDTGSRILCVDQDQLVVTRCARVPEWVDYYGWRMSDGWVLVEHPRRGETILYLSDPRRRPHLATWYGPEAMTMEPSWPMVPVRPEETVGYALAIVAGERCGADIAGAWVACRAPLSGGGVRSAVVGRLRDGATDAVATILLGEERRQTPIAQTLLPGVGEVSYAVAEFPRGRMELPLDVTFAGIAARRA